MLKIVVELHPFGNAKLKRQIAEMDLWNDTSGDRYVGNYEGSSVIPPSAWNADPIKRGGKVLHYDRAKPVFTLIKEMLQNMGY
jgi:hypothetical protein